MWRKIPGLIPFDNKEYEQEVFDCTYVGLVYYIACVETPRWVQYTEVSLSAKNWEPLTQAFLWHLIQLEFGAVHDH